MIPRREWLKNSVLAGTTLLVDFDRWGQGDRPQAPDVDPMRSGTHLGDVGFIHEPRVPLGTLLGSGLDGRLYTDLSAVLPENAVTPITNFYVRTRASEMLDDAASWQIRLTSAQNKTTLLRVAEMQKLSSFMGRHLMECSGNSREAHFGMLSVGDWAGVPIGAMLDRLGTLPRLSRILISAFDHYPQPSATSVEGASWVFTAEQLQASGAFLALQMNGEPLTKDHGAPVRLLVPGWYGCTCIKWVNEISVVTGDEPATSQMLEFAVRTHQDGVPRRASEYRPALIQQGALPIRVEKWSVDGHIQYRVLGILWGGTEPAKTLQIRFNPEEDYVAVDHFRSTANDPWSFWSHVWTPKARGTYAIRLRIAEPVLPRRRLDAGFFVRSVEISEV